MATLFDEMKLIKKPGQKEVAETLSNASGIEIKPKEITPKNIEAVKTVADSISSESMNDQDVEKMSFKELKQASGQSEGSKKDNSSQEKLFYSLMAILPTVVGGALGGASGAARGAQSTSQFFGQVGQQEAEKERQNRMFAFEKEKQEGIIAAKKEEREEKLAEKKRADSLDIAKLSLEERKTKANEEIAKIEKDQKKVKNKEDGEDKLRDDFLKNDVVKQYQKASEGIFKMRELAKAESPSGADDIALIYASMKTVDPASVVREGEYATAQRYSGTLSDKFGVDVNRILNGKGILTPAQRKSILAAAERQYPAYEKPYKEFASSIRKISEKRGYDPESVLASYSPQTQGPAVDQTAPSMSLDDQRALEWAKANPEDPRSKQIMVELQTSVAR